MGMITPSFTRLLGGKFRPGETAPNAPETGAQIPDEIVAKVRRDSLRLAAALPFLSLGAFTVIQSVFNVFAFDPTALSPRRVLIFLLVNAVISAINYRGMVRRKTETEKHYRERHGRWRWEP
jgi:hypothetical protein